MEYFRYNFHGIMCLTASVFNLVLGFVVLSKHPKSYLHRSYLLITISAFIWTFSWGMISLVRSIEKAYFWGAMQYLGSPFISPSVYLFSSLWLNQKGDGLKIRIGFIVASFISIPLFLFTRQIVEIREAWWGRYDRFLPNPLITWFVICLIIFFFLYAFMSLVNFYRGWKQSVNPQARIQFRNIFLAFTIAYTGSSDWFVSAGFDIYPYGFISLTVLQVFVAYNLLRHKLLDVNLFVKKIALILVIYAGLFVLIVPAIAPIIRLIIESPGQHAVESLFVIGLIVGVSLSAGPLIYAAFVRHSFWLRGHSAAGLAHELKSPLGVIQSASEVITDGLTCDVIDREKFLYYLGMIRQNASRLEGLTGDLLNVARMDNVDSSLNRVKFNIVELTLEVIHSFEPAYVKKGLYVRFDGPKELIVNVDLEKWKQIVSNLLLNAIKFSEKGFIRIQMENNLDVLVFSVEDQGCGIAANHLSHIFDRFYKVDPASKGSGIGLTIVKVWVEAHGGRIWAESQGRGKGARIILEMPL